MFKMEKQRNMKSLATLRQQRYQGEIELLGGFRPESTLPQSQFERQVRTRCHCKLQNRLHEEFSQDQLESES